MLFLQASGVLLFLKGFFLTRKELSHTSTCVGTEAARDVGSSTWGGSGCTPGVPRRFRRAIIVVIDALRFDFLASAKSRPVDENSGGDRFCKSAM